MFFKVFIAFFHLDRFKSCDIRRVTFFAVAMVTMDLIVVGHLLNHEDFIHTTRSGLSNIVQPGSGIVIIQALSIFSTLTRYTWIICMRMMMASGMMMCRKRKSP